MYVRLRAGGRGLGLAAGGCGLGAGGLGGGGLGGPGIETGGAGCGCGSGTETAVAGASGPCTGAGRAGLGLGAGTRLRHTGDTRERFANACEHFANALATIPGQRLDPWTPTFKTGTLLLRIREKGTPSFARAALDLLSFVQ